MIVRDAESIIKRVENAKVIVFGCGIEASSTEAKGTVLLKGENIQYLLLLFRALETNSSTQLRKFGSKCPRHSTSSLCHIGQQAVLLTSDANIHDIN